MGHYSPSKALRVCSEIKTVEDSLKSRTPSIGEMFKNYGPEKTEAFIKLWLIDLNESLNLNKPLKESHIDQTAFLIMQSYKNISMSDLNLIFTKAKKGGYGQFYESLSMPKVLSWFDEYYNERADTAGELARRQHDAFTVDERRSNSNRISSYRTKEEEFIGLKHNEALKNFTNGYQVKD